MTQQEKFEEILRNPESSVLDFKKELYNFSDAESTGKFLKDIISFSNTVRRTSAFIIFGVKEKDGNLDLVGLANSIDDSILQNKIRNKAFPNPNFSYSTIIYQEKIFGLLEIPIQKHETPITATKAFRGLEIGKVYYRNGTSNTEANSIETINISDWFRSLPGNSVSNFNEEISQLIAKLTGAEIKLSNIFAEILVLSNRHDLIQLKEFAQAELKGIKNPDHSKFNYRIQNVFVSFSSITLPQSSFITITPEMVKKELREDENTFERNFFFHQPIIEIEEFIEMFKNEKTILASIAINSKQIFEESNLPMSVYVFKSNITNLYRNIRQKLIDQLMAI